MLKSLFIPLLVLPILLYSQNTTVKNLNKLLDDWHEAAAKADMPAYFEKIDEKGIYIGTDATEYWTKQEFYEWSKPYFDQGRAWTFIAKERHIYLSDDQNLAWFDEKLEASYGELRGSGVLRFKDGEWKIMHYVLSLPVPNDQFKEVLENLKSD